MPRGRADGLMLIHPLSCGGALCVFHCVSISEKRDFISFIFNTGIIGYFEQSLLNWSKLQIIF